jgi:hypothetical protein
MSLRAEIEVANYRRFTESSPLRFTLGSGFTAFVGPNNVGKSQALRFFYDLRPLWRVLVQGPNAGTLINAVTADQGSGVDVRDLIHTEKQQEPIRIGIRLFDESTDAPVPRPSECVIELSGNGQFKMLVGTPPRQIASQTGWGPRQCPSLGHRKAGLPRLGRIL